MRDSQLIEKFKAEDGWAWEIVYNRIFGVICHFVCNLINDKGKAEEIVNDSFLSIRDKNYQYDTMKGLEAILYRIARNKAIDHIREKKMSNEKLKEFRQIEEQGEEMDDLLAFELERAEFYDLIVHELNNQPLQRKKVAREYYLYGKAPKDIAKAMNIQVSTVYKHLEKIKAVLKDKYDTEKYKHLYP